MTIILSYVLKTDRVYGLFPQAVEELCAVNQGIGAGGQIGYQKGLSTTRRTIPSRNRLGISL